MTASFIENLSLTDLLLLIGLVGIGLKTIAEVLGWTPTNKLLREENQALQDRNRTLDEQKAELVLELAASKAGELKLFARIEALELKVRELESRDQGAVLAALAEHDVKAQNRFDLTDKRSNSHHKEHVALLARAVEALEAADFQGQRHGR